MVHSPVIRWKLGQESAFGKGLIEDDDGNTEDVDDDDTLDELPHTSQLTYVPSTASHETVGCTASCVICS